MIEQKLPPFATGVQLCLKELLYYKSYTAHWRAQPSNKSIWSQLTGGHQSKQKGRGMDFSEVRRYQAGDDIRAIDWRVTARTGKTHTKLFTEEREQPVILYLDLSHTMRFGSQLLFKTVQCAHLASLLSWLTVERKDRIGAVIDMGDRLIEIKPTARAQSALYVCHQLIQLNNQAITQTQAQYQSPLIAKQATNEPKLPFSHAIDTLLRLCPKGSDIIFISDFQRLHNDSQPLLNQLNQHNRLQFLHIFDPLEMGKTEYSGSEYVTNGKQSRWLNFGSTYTRLQLFQHYAGHMTQIEEMCRDTAIPICSFSSAEPLLQQLSTQSQPLSSISISGIA